VRRLEPFDAAPGHITLKADHIHNWVSEPVERGCLPIDRRQDGDVGARHLPRELRGYVGSGDASRINQLIRRVELLDPFQKERSLLGEEDRFAWIVAELGFVGFDLREIRLEGAVHRHVRRNAPSQVAAELRALRSVLPRASFGGAINLRRNDGVEVQHEAAMQIGQTFERSRLHQERRARTRRGRPCVVLTGTLHTADDLNAPVLRGLRLITQALERDPNFHFIPVIGRASFRSEHVIGTQIGRLAFCLLRHLVDPGDPRLGRPLGHRAVALDAEGIHAEHDRLATVVERADENLDVVVRLDLVAVRQSGVDGAGRSVRPDAEVNRGRRIPDQHLCSIVRRAAVDGGILGESGERYGLTPRRFLQRAVHRDLRVETRDTDPKLIVDPAVHRRVRPRLRTNRQSHKKGQDHRARRLLAMQSRRSVDVRVSWCPSESNPQFPVKASSSDRM
jgi:hypothetical protein